MADEAGGDAVGEGVSGDVLVDEAMGADDGVLANGDAGHDGRMGTNFAVALNSPLKNRPGEGTGPTERPKA